MTRRSVSVPTNDTTADAARLRPFTLPNVVTVARLALVPLFCWLALGLDELYSAAWVLAVLGATDWVDGYLARRLGQVSLVGKVLDPVADRVAIGTAIITVLILGLEPTWFVVVVLAREALVTVGTMGLAMSTLPRLDVRWAGKAGTFGLYLTFPMMITANSDIDQTARDIFGGLAWFTGAGGLVLGWYAVVQYVLDVRNVQRHTHEPEGESA